MQPMRFKFHFHLPDLSIIGLSVVVTEFTLAPEWFDQSVSDVDAASSDSLTIWSRHYPGGCRALLLPQTGTDYPPVWPFTSPALPKSFH